MVSLGSGLSLGGSVLIAQQHGAGDEAKVNHFAAQSVTTLVIIALLLSVLGFLAAPFILQMLGTGENIYPNALAYLRITLIGSVFAFPCMAYQSILRSLGEARAPLLIEHCAVVLRIFVLGFPLSGIQMAMYGAFRGAGNTFSAMLLTLTGIWVIQIPLCVILSQYTPLGEMGLWWTSFIASSINTAIAVIYFKSNRWKRRLTV